MRSIAVVCEPSGECDSLVLKTGSWRSRNESFSFQTISRGESVTSGLRAAVQENSTTSPCRAVTFLGCRMILSGLNVSPHDVSAETRELELSWERETPRWLYVHRYHCTHDRCLQSLIESLLRTSTDACLSHL